MKIIDFIIQALKGTPAWVFIIFGYVLFVGIQALKTRTVPIIRLFILPTILFLWGIYTAINKFSNPLTIVAWILALLLGGTLSWLYYRKLPIKVNRQQKTVTLPGSTVTLILVLLIFGTKYLFGYIYATNPLAHTNLVIQISSLVTSGIITGIFVGRAGAYYQKYIG